MLRNLGLSCILQSPGPGSQVSALTARLYLQTLPSVTAPSEQSSTLHEPDSQASCALGLRLYHRLQRCVEVPSSTRSRRGDGNDTASCSDSGSSSSGWSNSQCAVAPVSGVAQLSLRQHGQASFGHSSAAGQFGLQRQQGLQAPGALQACLRQPQLPFALQGYTAQPGGAGLQLTQLRLNSNLSRRRVPKSAAINTTLMPNTTQLQYGTYGIRALTERRVAANTIEAVRRTLRRRLKKTAALWVRINATVPVTRKPLGIRMGKGKGAIEFYACAVRPGQIVFEMDRVSKKVALAALESIRAKFPCKLGFVEWS